MERMKRKLWLESDFPYDPCIYGLNPKRSLMSFHYATLRYSLKRQRLKTQCKDYQELTKKSQASGAHTDSNTYLRRLIENTAQNLMKRRNFAHLSKYSLLHFLSYLFCQKSKQLQSSFNAFFTKIITIAFDTIPENSTAGEKKINQRSCF